MFNTSEGLITTGALAALVQMVQTAEDWRVQAAAALAIGILASAYVVMRQKTKAAEAEVAE